MADKTEINGREIEYTDWYGLYKERWVSKTSSKGGKVDVSVQAMGHPAKFSRALIRRIYAHFIEKGYIQAGELVPVTAELVDDIRVEIAEADTSHDSRSYITRGGYILFRNCDGALIVPEVGGMIVKTGSTVLDIFGGVALGALDAMANGMNWVGIEVEPRFVAYGVGGECDGTPVEIGENTSNVFSGWYILFEDEDDTTYFVDRGGGVSPVTASDGFDSREDAQAWFDEISGDKSGTALMVFGDIRNVRIEYHEFGRADKIMSVTLCGRRDKHEPHHIDGNLELFERNYAGKLTGWGRSVLINGDSRYLIDTLRKNASMLPFPGRVSASVSSPPFLQTSGGTNVTSKEGVLADEGFLRRLRAGNAATRAYGESDGQIQAMSEGEFDAVLSSPPYAETRIDGKGDEGSSNMRNPDGSYLRGPEGWAIRKSAGGRYGDTDGQLGNLSEGSLFDCTLTSPPFESVTSDRPSESIVASGLKMGASSMGDGYGTSEGQTGAMSGETFWGASKMILEGLHSALRENGYAAFVVKSYVKNGKIEDFPRKWALLCEASGFEVVEWIRAWVTENRGVQYDLWGNRIEKVVERKSFFRKLAEANGSPRIDYEEVVIVRRV